MELLSDVLMKSFDSLIGPETQAALDDAEKLMALVTRTMPRAASKHVVFCRLLDGRLRLTLDHAAWVAKLRFNERQILRALEQEGLRIKQVSWHVAPIERRAESAEPPRQPVVPGRDTIAGLEALARSLAPDDPLARSLNKLASTLTDRSSR